MVEIIIAAVVAIVVGFLIGYFLMQKVLKERNDATALEAQNALVDAQREAESMKREALVEAAKITSINASRALISAPKPSIIANIRFPLCRVR